MKHLYSVVLANGAMTVTYATPEEIIERGIEFADKFREATAVEVKYFVRLGPFEGGAKG